MVDDITEAIEILTARTVGYRLFLRDQRRGEVNRLAEKLKQAAGVAQRATTRIEARADALIEREGAIRNQEERAFSPHEAVMADAEKGLDAVERALGQMSNAPLLDSGASLEGFAPMHGTQQPEAPKNESTASPSPQEAAAKPADEFQPTHETQTGA